MAAPSETDDNDAISDASSTTSAPTIQEPQIPDDWRKFVHLNGSVYYYNRDRRLLTTENVANELVLGGLLKVYRDHRRWLHALRHWSTSPDDEMLIYRPSGTKCDDLLVVFSSRHDCLTYEYQQAKNRVVEKPKSEFWSHISQYPMHRTYLLPFMEPAFLSALAFGANERVLDEKTTTFPFEDAQILRLTQVYFDLKASDAPLVPALAYHIAKVMFHIEEARARYAYGTPAARLYRDLAIPESTLQVFLWDIPIGILFCGTHRSYRTRLACTVPKGLVSLPDFRRLMQNMMAEWADSNLVATVFVSVNVGFLAVPGITTLQRDCSLVSSLCAMASIVTGLHHVWQHRQKTDAEIEDAINYIHFLPRKRKPTPESTVPVLALTLTACLLALPLATLQWSVLSFTVAIAAFALQATTTAEHDILLALLVLLVTLACAAFLFFWRIWLPPLHREMEEGLDPNVAEPPPPMWRERLEARVKAVAEGVGRFLAGF
ncbi:hypothetical protein B0H17DRAFT_1072971 [Mycena rosella]|uniref:WW domain-containing protein n=1 Tax=Mycena rosella TaxID=1033263 RepID=A0AAD7DCC2_MYCRO|nr:hypothetical protein B0H17DRAFT_1072971 [Mycena rosella]